MLQRKFLKFMLLISTYTNIACGNISNKTDPNTEGGQLVFAHILFRHGDRTPVELYPNDPWKGKENWPEGLGQLTNVGKNQHFELGQYFRRRYQKLLGNNRYSTDNIYIQSTDVDRTLMSAESNMAGLFPPKDDQIWNKNLMWQAIPIHTIPEYMDYILAAKRSCAQYEHALKRYQQSPEFKVLLDKFRPLMFYLEQSTGKAIRTLTDVGNLYNTLWIENLKNKTLPEWTKKVFFSGSDMEWIANFTFQMPTNTPELARLKSGFLLKDILNRFSKKMRSELTPDRSLWIYSAHDITISSILNSLGLFQYPHNPPYASSVLFEMYHKNGTYYIKIVYRNTTDEYPQSLFIPNCGYGCLLQKFSSLYKAIIPTKDFETECRLSFLSLTYEEANFGGYGTGFVALSCCIFASILVIFIAWKYWLRKRKNKVYLSL